MTTTVDQLFVLQCALEEKLRKEMNQFERLTGMSVHSVKIFRSELVSGRRRVVAIEVSAMLR